MFKLILYLSELIYACETSSQCLCCVYLCVVHLLVHDYLMVGGFVADMLGGSGSQRFERGRLSPDPLTMGAHHSSLPPPVAREELLSRHYDMPPSRMMGGGDFDREPSLLDQVMSERQRGGWRIEEPIPPRFEEPAESGGGRRVFIRNVSSVSGVQKYDPLFHNVFS